MIDDTPLPNGSDGRDPETGQFLRGHKFAVGGDPTAAAASKLRQALLDAVTEEDVREVWRALTDAAKGGDVAAIKVWLDRLYGRAVQPVVAELLDHLPPPPMTAEDEAIAARIAASRLGRYAEGGAP